LQSANHRAEKVSVNSIVILSYVRSALGGFGFLSVPPIQHMPTCLRARFIAFTHSKNV